MTKRWERELRTLNDIPAPLERIRDRADQGPSGGAGLDLPPRRQRIVAGVVAFAVFAAVGAFAWRAFDLAEPSTPGDTGDLPVLSVTFESAGFIDDAPDSSTRRVDTVIDYGDAHEENFTSTIPDNAVVEWVGVGQLTPYVPGPTAGSAVTINADGQDPRVLIGRPEDWPSFRKFERIDHLPSSPGDYVLLFEADYPEGRAMTARRVNVVEPGVLQLLLTEGGKLDGARASAYVDGDGVDGFLSTSTFAISDVGGQSTPRAPVFGGQKRLLVTNGATIILGTPASAVSAGLIERYSLTPDHLPLDLSGNEPTLSSSPGVFLLAVDAEWLHGVTTYEPAETTETARFFFPIEVVSATENQPSAQASPSTDASAAGATNLRETVVEQGAGRLSFAYGALWVAESSGMARIHPATGEVVARIEVPGITPAGTQLAFSEYGGTDRGSSIAAAAGLIWVTAEPKIVGIDPSSNSVVASISESSSIVSIAPANNDLLLVGGMAEGNGDLRLIDPTAKGSIYLEERGVFLDAFPQVLATDHWYWAASGTVKDPPAASRWSTDFSIAQTISVPAIRSVTQSAGGVWMTSDTSLYKFDEAEPSGDAAEEIEPDLTLPVEGPSIVAGDSTSLWLLEATGSTYRLIQLDPQSGESLLTSISLAYGGPAELTVVEGQPWITFRDEGLLVTLPAAG